MKKSRKEDTSLRLRPLSSPISDQTLKEVKTSRFLRHRDGSSPNHLHGDAHGSLSFPVNECRSRKLKALTRMVDQLRKGFPAANNYFCEMLSVMQAGASKCNQSLMLLTLDYSFVLLHRNDGLQAPLV
ncbi:hypothetical protein CIHG_02080 [Coccidioides immitis H538.4]|uniref:Uncharacterized protein n=1 Tax=Coccidioides immitis H538.4 TaxID=396776 RepID=A0A0J8RK33_COCIT|nr:hypothetical protein CIHG_02080 [Coccidioides immitis H538.4]